MGVRSRSSATVECPHCSRTVPETASTSVWRTGVKSRACQACDRWFVVTTSFLQSAYETSYRKTTAAFGIGDDYRQPDRATLLRSHLRGGPLA